MCRGGWESVYMLWAWILQGFCSSSPMGWVLLQDIMGNDYLFPFVSLFALFKMYRVEFPNHQKRNRRKSLYIIASYCLLFFPAPILFPLYHFLFYFILSPKLPMLLYRSFSFVQITTTDATMSNPFLSSYSLRSTISSNGSTQYDVCIRRSSCY